MAVSSRDIRGKAGDARAEEEYRAILETIEEGYYETDLEGRLTFFNEALCRILGYSRKELKGLGYQRLMDRDHAARAFRTFRRVYLTGRPDKALDWEFVRKDGTRIPVEASVLVMRDADGKTTGFRGIVRDVSDRSRADVLLAAKIKAEAESRAKSGFLANMSHEIRTPLNAIIGMTELAMDTDLSEGQKEIVHVINRESENLLGLINDILDFSKIEADRYELEEIPFDLRVLIEDLAHSFAMRAERKGIELVSFISPGIHTRLVGDPGRLRQVIANLVGNALKFTEKGEIFIKVEQEEDRGSELVLKFSVRDTGIGIPPDRQGRIFESFTQADGSTARQYGGTGLGLAISSRIVEMMGGEIVVESTVGQGSTFSFTAVFGKGSLGNLPLLPEDLILKDMRVLVVDDNETNRFILLEYLRSWGCIPEGSPGGKEALAVLKAAEVLKDPFDLILMDFHMPKMDGFELSRKIRGIRSLRKIPIILLTSVCDIGDGKLCRDIGIQGYLHKPARKDDLRKAVISVLGLSVAEEEDAMKLVTRHSIDEDFRKDVQVLLVEDYPTSRQVLMRHLCKAGFQVDIAENGQQAVAAFKRKRYDLILMDIQMPVMDGYEATKRIRRWEEKMGRDMGTSASGRRDSVPIIAMTAHFTPGYRERCLGKGMDDYLAKPLRREDMIRCLDKWVRHGRGKGQEIGGSGRSGRDGKGRAGMSGTGDPIDLAKAMSEFDADRDFLKEILGGFLNNVRKQIELIRTALADGNADTIRREAHSIKGGAANICADDLSRAASDLELLGKGGNLDGARPMLQRLEEELIRLETFDREGL